MDETTASVDDAVRSAFASELFLPFDQVTADAPLAALAGLDSVTLLRIIVVLETEYWIALDDEQLYGLTTVGDVIALVDETLRARAGVGG
ncbi:acyl carrier protein [Kitasatospora sp. NPDC094011]|uniref:acyl carrier protein n=1 Tax=Kitasatospora sp. NPDC094011 TaxID=3364090 RepID=UPI00382C5CBC